MTDLVRREDALDAIYGVVTTVSVCLTAEEAKIRTDTRKRCEDAVASVPAVDAASLITGETSDGYHTFNELYHHRAVLFSVIVRNYPERAWKAKRHADGTMYDGMFIVGIDTPDGQATYHYDIDPYWDMFNCRVLDNAPEWDGHTPAQAIERIGKIPAVDAVEAKHGQWHGVNTDKKEWTRTDGTPIFLMCSECQNIVINNASAKWNYCPTCGAKMDGGETDEH